MATGGNALLDSVTGKVNPKDSDGNVITEGLFLSENGTPDLDVLYTKGAVRDDSDNYYYTASDGSVSVTAATAGNAKLAIIQKPSNGVGAPTVKDGSETGTGATNIASAASPTTPRAIFDNGTPDKYVIQSFSYTNTSGADYVIDEVQSNSQANAGTITLKLYSAPDDGGGDPDWDNKTLLDTKTGVGYGTETHTWSSLSVALNNNDTVWLLIEGSAASNLNLDWNIYCDTNPDVTLASGIATLHKKSDDEGVTWAAELGASSSWKLVQAGAVDPSYPSVDANNILIGYVGDTTTPIDESTDAIVEASPTGTQVQLIPVNDHRL